jgi:hypothetical protein
MVLYYFLFFVIKVKIAHFLLCVHEHKLVEGGGELSDEVAGKKSKFLFKLFWNNIKII